VVLRLRPFPLRPFSAAVLTPRTIVVQGGTLIDGTGHAPIENAVVMIENGRFP
jgi:hypothetical protein